MSEDDTRRRHPRVDTQQSVWVEGQDVRVVAEARNMSKGGMFVVSKAEAPAIGTTLQVKFDDPLEGAIEVKMEVVWRDESTVTSKLGLRALDSHGMGAFERVVTRYEAAHAAARDVELGAEQDETLRPTSPGGEPDSE